MSPLNQLLSLSTFIHKEEEFSFYRKGAIMELTGKVALVTGAGSGIGKAAAVLLAKHGARVAPLSHTADEIEQTAREIQQGGGEAIAVVADISQDDQMRRAVQQVIDR